MICKPHVDAFIPSLCPHSGLGEAFENSNQSHNNRVERATTKTSLLSHFTKLVPSLIPRHFVHSSFTFFVDSNYIIYPKKRLLTITSFRSRHYGFHGDLSRLSSISSFRTQLQHSPASSNSPTSSSHQPSRLTPRPPRTPILTVRLPLTCLGHIADIYKSTSVMKTRRRSTSLTVLLDGLLA